MPETARTHRHKGGGHAAPKRQAHVVDMVGSDNIEAELKSHSAWRTDDETPPTTNGPSQSGI